MRLGMNPNRGVARAYNPARVTVCVLVHIPNVSEGYHQHHLTTTSLCLSSLIKHADAPFELMVFDNGSCPEVRVYLANLYDHGLINYLVYSKENIGKPQAVKRMVAMAPGEVVGIADDDVYFYPGWLSKQLAVLDHFPNVGNVSGFANTTSFRWGIESNKTFGQRPDVKMTVGKRIPEEWERDFATGIGRELDRHLAMTRQENDIVLEYNGMEAFATSHHIEYLAFKKVIEPLLQDTGGLMGAQRELDMAIDAAGLLRLSTIEKTIHYLANVLDERSLGLAESHGIVKRQEDPVSE